MTFTCINVGHSYAHLQMSKRDNIIGLVQRTHGSSTSTMDQTYALQAVRLAVTCKAVYYKQILLLLKINRISHHSKIRIKITSTEINMGCTEDLEIGTIVVSNNQAT